MKKVLVVEDELSIANFISDVIQMLGFEPKNLTSGTKVLSTAKSWKPDLITLDIMMPPPDGIEVLNQLKNDPETQHIPVFIISVVANKDDVIKQVSKAQKVFAKPLDTRQFIEELQKLSRK